jgi:flagellar assembly protein FliH
MSTSPSRSPSVPLKPESPSDLQPFPYHSIPPDAVFRAGRTIPNLNAQSAQASESGAAHTAALEAQARAQGRQEGLADARKTFEEQLARERSTLVDAVTQFSSDRDTYFRKVEAEVVQLALGIARRILHREAQIDPLLLAGMVRVALEKIDGATEVSLRIHPAQAAQWRSYLSQHKEASELPEIIEDPAQEPDRCTLQTSMGTAIVGVEVQLKEIEQGLLDLLAVRPGPSP